MELIHFQQYWWLIISVLGAILVFLLFVQGGQTMFLDTKDVTARQMMVNSIGRKWELTFTTLVTFGGAFFASFPLFYSTSFGGAYWLWMLILLSFIIQAISYEFRRKPGNIFGTRFYDTLLFFNGSIGCILLGVAVGTMFFGGEFTIVKTNILDPGAPVISQWAGSHGLEAIADWRNLLLGLVVLFLA
ncbi:MAG: cytochrome d ubiquinol oxidase subunit II, partial [Muribaculaceae bacterium]|nr:cytochrome d ubiquinol oxidase subunit II [Muribaculaceae bacterium]